MSSDRTALNEEIAFQKWEGYAKPIDRGRHVNFGEKFVFATDYVMMSPHFNDGAPQSAADMFSDEVAAAIEAGQRRAAERGSGKDTAQVVGNTLYLHTPDGFGRSELSLFLLGRSASPVAAGTARNWATVTKLLALCDA